jgi:aspartate aminotransferase
MIYVALHNAAREDSKPWKEGLHPMALTLSRRCLNIAPSVTLGIDARAKALIAAGEDVIGLAAGEPDFDTPAYIREAAKYALDHGMTRYTPVPGTLRLREAIAKKLKKDNGLEYGPSEIIVTNGAKHALFGALAAIVNPGDEVLLPTPAWVSYPEMIRMNDGVVVPVPGREEDGFLVGADAIAPLVTGRTKALILNSPNNPNGSVWPREMLEGIARLAVEKGFYVISDEIYEKLIYEGGHVSIASLSPEIKAQTIVVNGHSKAYAMTGWRVGYAAGPQAVIKAMSAHQSHATSNACSITQYAAAAALESDGEDIAAMAAEFDARRLLMHQLIGEIDGLSALLPKGAFYTMVNVSGAFGKALPGGAPIENADDFAARLLDEVKVAVVPGTAFGAPAHVRLSYATSREKIREGMARIAAFMARLK